MGIERFEDGDDPTPPADADPSKDADRSEEVASSSDVRRAEDQTPDSPRRESPEGVAAKQAEPRTRDEYADHLAPPNSSPIDEDPSNHKAEERGYPQEEEEDRELTHPHPQESRSGDDLSMERHQNERQPEVPDSASVSDVKQGDSDNNFPGLTEEKGKTGATTNESEQEPISQTIEPASSTEAPNAYLDPGLERSGLDDTLRVNDQVRDSGGNELSMEVADAPATVAPLADSNDANFASSNEGPTPDSDRLRPLTDAEWAGHLIEVREGLAQAESKGLTPERMYTINGAGEVWTDERELMHQSILEKFYSEAANVPCTFKAVIAGGLGGAGKTTVLTEHANIDLSQYLMINPDIFKAEMARRGMIPEVKGLSPMEAADLVHEESSYLALQLALRAQSDGKNVIWDITMSNQEGRRRTYR